MHAPLHSLPAGASWMDQVLPRQGSLLYLTLAALLLVLALRFMRRALAPIGAVMQAVAAAAVVAFAVGLALVLVALAAFSGG
jgi:hypothetical protein